MSYERPPGYFESLGTCPPRKHYVEANAVTIEQVQGFERLVRAKSGEMALDEYLRSNRELFANFLGLVSTGNQGAWIIPQQPIKMCVKDVEEGLIPDYLFCGRSSDGYAWWIIELKGANAPLLKRSGRNIGFSSTTNHAIFQLLKYIVFCNEHQSSLREQLRLTDFTRPRGMLVIGTEDEFEDQELQKLKAAWNRVTSGELEIRTYDALVRFARQKAVLYQKGGPTLEDWEFPE